MIHLELSPCDKTNEDEKEPFVNDGRRLKREMKDVNFKILKYEAYHCFSF
jgi:hypothetical protein